uniref:TPX2 domain-containing protein n=1 Tax=Trichuris muris TaxID=70415 RepID=A0A5S6QVT7_TRIMR
MDNILEWSNVYESKLCTPLQVQPFKSINSNEKSSTGNGDCSNPIGPPGLLTPFNVVTTSNVPHGELLNPEETEETKNDSSMFTGEKENNRKDMISFLSRVDMYKRNREARIKACRLAMERSAKRARMMHAKPAPKFPSPKWATRGVKRTTTPEPFHFTTAERAERRKEFERRLKEKQAQVEKMLAEKRKTQEELEAEEIRQLRKRTVIRARPILCKLPPRREAKNTH